MLVATHTRLTEGQVPAGMVMVELSAVIPPVDPSGIGAVQLVPPPVRQLAPTFCAAKAGPLTVKTTRRGSTKRVRR